MARYKATLMHGERGGEGTYYFEAEDGLIEKSAFTTTRRFMEHLEATAGLGNIDWHASGTMRNDDKKIVTAIGNFVFNGDDEQPFVCLISYA